MSAAQLRVFYGPEVKASRAQHDEVNVPLSEVLPLLADAHQSQRTWLRDFKNDEVTISSDLYEVLMAYRHYRPSA